MSRALIGALAGLALAAACAPMAPAPTKDASACHVERYQKLVGHDLIDADRGMLPKKHRIICFGCMATMEIVADRLTVQMGPGDKVASVRCG